MRKINYKSDFDFLMRLKDSAGKEVPFPECDWDAMFWTSSKAKAYKASYRDGAYTNCRKEANGILFIFDSHAMGLGTLHWEPHFRLPNDIYPDGYQDLFRKRALDIELVDGDGDEATETEITFIAPYIKGDKGDPGRDGSIQNMPMVKQTESLATIQPNVLNVWGVMDSLTINFAQGSEDYVCEYCIEFSSGNIATVLTLPASVQFPDDPIIEPNMRYQISVVNNFGLIAGVEL